jgi:hypothetical protein
MFNTEVTVGNLVAVGAAIISAVAILAALAKERALRKKELADRVRQSTALVVAKLDRWKQIALQTFDQLQMAATEADGQLIAGGDDIATRDSFWKQVVTTQASLAKSVLDEEIEVAYSNLFGYDPRIHDLFTGAVLRLRHIESFVFLQVLNRTQNDILNVRADGSDELVSAKLGNRLRYTLAESRCLLEESMEAVLAEFRKGMLPIIRASDDDLVHRKIAIPASTILPGLASLQDGVYPAATEDRRACKAIFDSSRNSRFGSGVVEPWPLAVEFPEDFAVVSEHGGDHHVLRRQR